MSKPWATFVTLAFYLTETGIAQPVRRFDDPGSPPFKVLKTGDNPPLDVDGNYVIGPEYTPAPERKVVEGVPQGKVKQFTIDSKETKLFNPGIARTVFGKVDPKNPKTLIVETRNIDYKRQITVYIPAQYVAGSEAPFMVCHDGPTGKPNMELARILDNLIAQKRVPPIIAIMVANGWSARCPAHEDRKASLSVSAADDGAALVKCHAGCETSAILAAVGLKLADLFPPKAGATRTRNGKPTVGGRLFATANEAVAEVERPKGKRSAMWTYHDAHDEPVGIVVRWDKPSGKDIRPAARHTDGWRIGAMPDPRPLYDLPDLAAAKRVVVCEGEKAAEAARALGFIATTSAGGSQAAMKTDWRPLAGKEIWIIPDNDAPGRKYADAVASILAKLTPAPVIRVVELPDLPDCGDIVDWIDTQGEAAEPNAMRAAIEAHAQTVEPWRPNNADDLAFRPFPVDALPEPIRGFVDAGARAIGCDTSYLALPLLTAIAAAIGNTRRLELKRGWSAAPILWGAIVGESGTAKTPAFKLVMRPLRERQSRAFRVLEAQQQEYEVALETWQQAKKGERGEKPQPPSGERFIVSDTTVEALAPILLANPRGLLLAGDELAGWIGSFDRYAGKGKASADSANWLSMFNAESIIVDRKTGIPRTIHVPQAAVCVSGGIQPAIHPSGGPMSPSRTPSASSSIARTCFGDCWSPWPGSAACACHRKPFRSSGVTWIGSGAG